DASRTDEGLAAAMEAVAGYLELSGDTPGVLRPAPSDGEPDNYRPALAKAYMTLAKCFMVADQPTQALRANEESTRLLLVLASSDRPRFEPDLAAAFSNLSAALLAVGRHAEAAGTAQNAVLIFRRLAAKDPARYNRRLATAHYNLSVALIKNANPRHA